MQSPCHLQSGRKCGGLEIFHPKIVKSADSIGGVGRHGGLPAAREKGQNGGMAEDLAAFVAAMDRCWLERRFEDLAAYLAEDVVMAAPGGGRVEGLASAVESYREFMSRSRIARFAARDHAVTLRGDTAVVEYGWDMAWESGAESERERHEASGREVLVLARRADGWRVVWRTQPPA